MLRNRQTLTPPGSGPGIIAVRPARDAILDGTFCHSARNLPEIRDPVKGSPGRHVGRILHSWAKNQEAVTLLSPDSDWKGEGLSPKNPAETGKAMAGAKAAEAVSPGMKLGLGTGSTVAHFLASLSKRLEAGEIPGIVGVPTSIRTQKACEALGIPLGPLEGVGQLDLTVDGADEVDPQLDLIKGLGGALLREKMVAQATDHLIIIVDEGKVVDRLGTRSPLPVEVVPFSWESHVPILETLGARPILRTGENGEPYLTDNGNFILDCRFHHGIKNPVGLNNTLAGRAGIVESGLFLGMAGEVLIGTETEVVRITRNGEKS